MPEPSFVRRFLRERALSRYLAALERGDIDAVIALLEQASRDRVLEQMIFDLHETYQTEEEFLQMVQQVQEEPDVVEVENGVFKSRLVGKLPDLRRVIRHRYRIHERISQVLAAVLLTVCVLATVLVTVQFQQNTPGASIAHPASPCMSAGASIPTYTGTPVFNQIAAISPDDIWIVGSIQNSRSSLQVQPLLEHWDGARWSVVPGVNIMPLLKSGGDQEEAFLSHLAVVSANDIWAVGGVATYSSNAFNDNRSQAGQPLIEHWDGHQWLLVHSAPDVSASYSVLNDLAVVSVNDIWAVGYTSDVTGTVSTGLVEHWDGRQWTRVQQNFLPLQVGVLDEIKAISDSDIWAFGRASQLFRTFPLAEHWNGRSWNVSSLTDAVGLGTVNAVTALSTDDIWIAGSQPLLGGSPAPVLVVRWDGRRWSRVADARELGTGSTLLGIKAYAVNDIWAVGSTADGRSLIEHWNGQKWATVQHVSPPFAYLRDITINNGKVWTVGATFNSDIEPTITGSLIEASC